MEVDVAVVGAGPAGLEVAARLAPDYRVAVIEEHREVGRPIQCSGLVTERVLERTGYREILARISAVTIHPPSAPPLTVRSSRLKAVVFNRAAFDRYCGERAARAGATLQLSRRFVEARQTERAIELTTEDAEQQGADRQTIATQLLIGADGICGDVARSCGLPRPPEFLPAIQYEVAGVSLPQDTVLVYLGSQVAPGFFAWAVPAGETTRIGLCTGASGVPSALEFQHRLMAREEFRGAQLLSINAGAIPVGLVPRTYGDRVLLVGDAAGMAKPLSGGGIYTGLVSGACAAQAARQALEARDLSSRMLREYERLWKAELGSELSRAYRLRKVFRALDDRKLDDAIELLRNPSVISYVAEHGDIDYPSLLAAPLLKSAPKLVRFAPELLKAFL